MTRSGRGAVTLLIDRWPVTSGVLLALIVVTLVVVVW